MRTRFQREARIAARLIHPHIVAVLDYGEDSSSYLVMERLPGTTLRDEMAHGPIPAPRVRLVAAETLAALAAAHKFGVLHRDIKPSNILVEDDGHAKIADFGIAKSFDPHAEADHVADDLTMTGVVLGTPGYLAPERRSGRPATVQSDLYSVGAVMVEALTGRRAAPGAVSVQDLPPPLRGVAARALSADPRERFPSAEAMLQAIRSPEATKVTALRATAGPPAKTAAPETSAPPATATVALPTATVRAAPRKTLGETVVMQPPHAVRGLRGSARRRRRALVAAAALAALIALLFFLVLASGNQPTRPTASATSDHGAQHSRTADAEGTALRSLATSLSNAGLPGDDAIARALDVTAGQTPGANRQAAAEQAIALAVVLLAGGGITSTQYQEIANALQATGATVPTTVPPTTVPTTPTHSGPAPHHDKGPGGQNN
jgi:serine/threonine-protein kinase